MPPKPQGKKRQRIEDAEPDPSSPEPASPADSHLPSCTSSCASSVTGSRASSVATSNRLEWFKERFNVEENDEKSILGSSIFSFPIRNLIFLDLQIKKWTSSVYEH